MRFVHVNEAEMRGSFYQRVSCFYWSIYPLNLQFAIFFIWVPTSEFSVISRYPSYSKIRCLMFRHVCELVWVHMECNINPQSYHWSKRSLSGSTKLFNHPSWSKWSFIKRAALAVVLFAIPYANSFNLPSTHHRHHVIKLNSRSSSALYSTLEKKPKSSSDVEEEDNFPNPEDVAALTTPLSDELSTKNILGSSIPYEDLTIGILKESYPGENRVSVAPESVKLLIDAGLNVVVESGGEYI